MSEELKPCPFCGGADLGRSFNYIHCTSCQSCGPEATEMLSAIQIWNRRSTQPEPAAPRTMIEDVIVGLANEAIKTPDASIADLLGSLGYVRKAAPTVVGPVAWMSTDCIGERYLCFTKPLDNDPVTPLYAHPPRTALSDAELACLYIKHARCQEEGPITSGWFDFARAVEAAIKEKQND